VVNRAQVDALLRDRFGGIRIEHTIAVQAGSGPEILTDALPTDPDEVLTLLG
jgi:Xaa-Pro aminopeptidase